MKLTKRKIVENIEDTKWKTVQHAQALVALGSVKFGSIRCSCWRIRNARGANKLDARELATHDDDNDNDDRDTFPACNLPAEWLGHICSRANEAATDFFGTVCRKWERERAHKLFAASVGESTLFPLSLSERKSSVEIYIERTPCAI